MERGKEIWVGGDWRKGEQAIHTAEKLAEQVLLHISAMNL